jgi:hypothetical protein
MLTSAATSGKSARAFHATLGAFIPIMLLATLTHGSTTDLAQAADAREESLPVDDFLRQYRDMLHRQMLRYHDVRADGDLSGGIERAKFAPTRKNTAQAPDEASKSFSFVRSGVNEKFHFIRKGRKLSDIATVREGTHGFRVRREIEGGPYMLVESATKSETWRTEEKLMPRVLDAPYSPAGLIEFPDYVMAPQFQVTQAVRTTGSDGPSIKFFLRYNSTQPKKVLRNLEGWVRLGCESDWVIRDYDLDATLSDQEDKHKMQVSYGGTVVYTQDKAGRPVPSEIQYLERRSTGTTDQTVFHLNSFTLGPTPPEEFTLAVFGLGDFVRPSERTTRQSAYYLAGIGVAAFASSVILATVARVRRRQHTDQSELGEPA